MERPKKEPKSPADLQASITPRSEPAESAAQVGSRAEAVVQTMPVLRIGRSEIVVLDEFPEADIVGPESATIGSAAPRLLIEIADVDAVLERAIAAGATVLRPAEDQWWGVRSGAIRDPFGYRWSIHSVVEALSEGEIQRRADELGLYSLPQPSDA